MIALENLRSRFNTPSRSTLAGFSEGRVCVVPERRGRPSRGVRVFSQAPRGVIGRRLLPPLLATGHEVTAMYAFAGAS